MDHSVVIAGWGEGIRGLNEEIKLSETKKCIFDSKQVLAYTLFKL